MRANTQTVTLTADPNEVYAFIAEPENLPRWAVGFCRAIRRDGERWRVETGHGDMTVRYVLDQGLGVIDFYLSANGGQETVAASRVVANGDEAEYIFTQFQAPDMPDEVFAGQCAALTEELEMLRILFRARAACAAGSEVAEHAVPPV